MKKITNLFYILIGIVILSISVQAQNFLTENFDGTFPATNWSAVIQTGSYNWARVVSGSSPTCSPKAGSGMLTYQSYNASTGSAAILTTPPINLTGSCKPTLSSLCADCSLTGMQRQWRCLLMVVKLYGHLVMLLHLVTLRLFWYEQTVALTHL